MIFDVKAAIFDMDGTILDSLFVWDKILFEFSESVSGKPDFALKDMVSGLSLREGAALLRSLYRLDMTTDEIVLEFNRRLAYFYENEVEAKPGVREYIEKLKASGIRVCVVTESSGALAEAAFRRLGMADLFDFMLSCQDSGTGKNTPDVYFEAAGRFDARPCECLVFEDALYALRTARNAGFHAVAVYDPYETRPDEMKSLADAYVESYEGRTPV